MRRKEAPTKFKFKYVSFSQRLSELKVDLLHAHSQPQDPGESFFLRALEKYRDLDCTLHFNRYLKSLPPRNRLSSLVQLLHERVTLASVTLDALRDAPELCLASLLEMTVALTRDLRFEFLPNFWEFYAVICEHILRTKDADVLEACYVALTQLFRFLWKRLLSDDNFEETFSALFQMLSTKRGYVRRFTSETASFLMRKIPLSAYERFLLLAIKASTENEHLSDGIGDLLFHSIRGVGKRLHSSAGETVRAWFGLIWKLGSAENEVFSKILRAANEKCVNFAATGATGVAEVFLAAIVENLKGISQSESRAAADSQSESRAAFNSQSESRAPADSQSGAADDSACSQSETVLTSALNAWLTEKSSSLLLNPERVLSDMTFIFNCQSLTSNVHVLSSLGQFLSDRHAEIPNQQLIDFCQKVTNHFADFPDDVLQFFENLWQMTGGIFDDNILPILIRYVNKLLDEPANYRMALDRLASLVSYKLKDHPKEIYKLCSVYDDPLAEIVGNLTNPGDHDSGLQITALYLAPNCGYIEPAFYCMKIKEVLAEIMTENDVSGNLKVLRYCARPMVMLHVLDETVNVSSQNVLFLTSKYSQNEDFLHFLLSWTQLLNEPLTPENREKLLGRISPQLMAGKVQIRLLAVRIFATLAGDVFASIEKAEEIIPDTTNFKERLRLLKQVSTGESTEEPPWHQRSILHYLLGSLYLNFQPLWVPTLDMIGDLASKVGPDFVSTILGYLTEVTSRIRHPAGLPAAGFPAAGLPAVDGQDFPFEMVTNDGVLNETPDDPNVRILILKLMKRHVSAIETKHRDFVPIFLDFFKTEYCRVDELILSPDGENERMDEFEVGQNVEHQSLRGASAKEAKKTLVGYLEVLGAFQNPRAVYMEPKVTATLDTLLCSNNPSIQEAAMTCIFAYKYKWLTPHRESMEKLMSKKGFTEQIVDFSLEIDSFPQKERGPLIKLLLKVVYGQLLNKTEKRKGGVKARRAKIFRFLATCSLVEMEYFIVDLILHPMKSLLSRDLGGANQIGAIDLIGRDEIPARRLLGMLSCIQIAIENVGDGLLPLASQVLRSLIFAGAIAGKIAAASDQSRKVAKALKREVFSRLIQFFQVLEAYNPTRSEYGSLVTCVIGPAVSRLPIEGVQSPTAGMRLLTVLAGMEKHMCLLDETYVSVTDMGPGATPISAMICLLESCLPPSQIEVVRFCRNLQETFGTELLTPFAPLILEYFKSKVLREVGSLTEDELTVLVALTGDCSSPEDAKLMCSSILTHINAMANRRTRTPKAAANQNAETAAKRLEVCAQLAKIAGEYPVLPVSELFFSTEDRTCRTLLASVVAGATPSTGEILRKMCAFDLTRMDEPDYDARLAALAQIKAQLLVGDVPSSALSCYINAAAHGVLHSDDTALRDANSFVLQKILEVLPGLPDFETLKTRLIFLIKRGLACKYELVRHEFASILRQLALKCREDDLFASIVPLLSDSEQHDDFIANLCHIQIPRRAATLRKTEMSASFARFAHEFLQPLILPYLTQEEYSKQNVLQDDAVAFLTKVYAHLPWKKYLPFLKRQISQLKRADSKKHVKLRVKLLSGILSAYHYTTEGSKPVLTMQNDIIPDLTALVAANTSSHRKSQGHSEEKIHYERELAKAPLVLALIKVLHRLPAELIDTCLPNLISKLCVLMRSPFFDVRESARRSLVHVVETLGPKYLPYIIRELRGLLNRGFHLEVMLNSVNILISQLEPDLKSGDLDAILPDLLELTNQQLFSKEPVEDVPGAVSVKLPEKKAGKAIHTYKVLGKLVSDQSLSDLLANLKDLTGGSYQRHTELRLMERICTLMAEGLSLNEALDVRSILTFALSILEDAVEPDRPPAPEGSLLTPTDLKGAGWKKPDCYLLDPAPKRTGNEPVRSKWTLNHVLVEFSLNILLQLFRRGKFEKTHRDLGLLNPFVTPVVQSLRSKHVKIITLALRALTRLLQFPLPKINQSAEGLIGQLFVLLNNWARVDSSSGKGDILELCLILFKAVTTTVRELKFDLTPRQQRVLLQYAEQSLLDTQKSHAGFSLLRALVGRHGSELSEMAEVMERLKVEIVKSTSDQYRSNARNAYMAYLKRRSLDERVKILQFFLVQLDYPDESGRRSALEIVHEILQSSALQDAASMQDSDMEIPDAILVQGVLHLAAFYNNESSEFCRKAAYVILKLLVEMVAPHSRSEILKRAFDWLVTEKFGYIRIALLLLQIYLEMTLLDEKSQEEFITGGVNQISGLKNEDSQDAEQVIFLILTLYEKILSVDFDNSSSRILAMLDSALEVSSHPYSWVMLASSKVIGAILQSEAVGAISQSDSSSVSQPDTELQSRLDGLFLAFVEQIRLLENDDNLFSEVLNNLVSYAARLDLDKLVSTATVLRKLCNPEIGGKLKTTTRRTILFRWVTRMLPTIRPENLDRFIPEISIPVFREILLTQGYDENLKQEATELGSLLKRRIGQEAYAQLMAANQKLTVEKRKKRKLNEALDKINPVERKKRFVNGDA